MKSCQPCYRIWSGFCRPVAGIRSPARQLLYKDRVERMKKDNGVNLRHTHGVETREIRISKADRKHMEEKMIPSQRRSTQAKTSHKRNKSSIEFLIFRTQN